MGVEQEGFTDGSSEFCPIARANGFESELNRLSKWLVVVFLAAAILWRHDAEALWAALGITLNAGLSTMLKQILNQERPLSTSRSDPGMPSSHAQAIFYVAISYSYQGASLVLYLQNSPQVVELLGVNAFTTTMVGFIFALGSYLSWLRVSQQFHTISQVVVGAVVGSIFAILWFWWWNAIVFDAFFSYLWVRIIVVLGAAGYCVAVLIYIIRCLAFPPSEFLYLGKHFPRKLVSFKIRAGNPYTMKEPIKTRIYREGNGDECVMGLEQEAFIDGSLEFRPIARANGFESTLNRSSKWLVAIFFAAAILWRHDAEAMWAALGCTLNAGLSNMLKQILNQERPLSTSRSDPGMPSSHAQSIFFTAIATLTDIPTSYSYRGASLVFYLGTLPKTVLESTRSSPGFNLVTAPSQQLQHISILRNGVKKNKCH
ncbi:hypothetical protein LguiA_014038 [Lonicera macranthoides]